MPTDVLLLAAGQNTPAPTGTLSVWVDRSAAEPVDLCALLVGVDGKVARDADFVFYNAPTHPSEAVKLTDGDPARPGLWIHPARIPSAIDRVLVAVSADGDGKLNGLTVAISGELGQQLTFTPTQLGGVRTAVLVEVYRRSGAWKVRAVGQGWASGLAGLARDYGITVDEELEVEQPTAAPPTAPRRNPSAATGRATVPPPDRDALGAEIGRLVEQRAALSAELFSLTKQVRDARTQLVQTDEAALLQDVGYYRFAHPLDDAPAYRERLDQLRGNIKAAIRDKTAVRSRPGWTVNGSIKEGAALVRDFSALMLRSYNVEADNCVRTVRPSNLAAITKRLDRTREAIRKLGAAMGVAIDDGYHELRLRELRLTADFQAKVEQEKEDIRAAREQGREDARALAELQREEARLLKERAQNETALAKLEAANDQAGQEQLRARLDAIDEGLRGVRERAANTRTGHVYVLSNVGAFGERMVKIGMTRRVGPLERVRELGNAAVPFRFDVHALIFSADAVGLEHALHTEFAAYRVNRRNLRREYFYITPAEVRDAVLRIGTDHVLEYHDMPLAEEWRESEALRAREASSNPAPAATSHGVRLRPGSG